MAIIRQFINANGSYSAAQFNTQEQADAYAVPDGATEIPVRPSDFHEWENGQWVERPAPTVSELDAETLNAALAAPGSVVRALAEVMFTEINKLRVKTGDPAYVKADFVTAIKARMR